MIVSRRLIACSIGSVSLCGRGFIWVSVLRRHSAALLHACPDKLEVLQGWYIPPRSGSQQVRALFRRRCWDPSPAPVTVIAPALDTATSPQSVEFERCEPAIVRWAAGGFPSPPSPIVEA